MHKFCPLSFFSFYVNKNQAQAGGAHVCVEEECAWWDESCDQCQVKTALELIGVMAESPRVRPNRKEKAVSGVSDMFSRLRNKSKAKKLPTTDDSSEILDVEEPKLKPVEQPRTKLVEPKLESPKLEPRPVEPKREPKLEPRPADPKSEPRLAEQLESEIHMSSIQAPGEKKEASSKQEVSNEHFDDLLQMPETPVSELPVISLPVDEEEKKVTPDE